MRFQRKQKFVFALIVIAGLVFLVLSSLRPGPATIAISTATRGGTYAVLGQQLARVLEDLPDHPIERVDVMPSGGSTENLDRLLRGEAEIAFVARHALERYDKEQRSNLRILARLYSDVLQLVVPAGEPAALRGKRIALGPQMSGTRLAAGHVLEAMGLSERDYVSTDTGSFEDTASALSQGRADAAFFAAGTPTMAVRKLLMSGDWRLAALADVDVDLTGYFRETLPAFSYENQPQSVDTWATDVFLISREDLDPKLAFAIVRGLFNNLKELLDVHSVARNIKLDRAFDPERMPEAMVLHRGALAFAEWVDQTLLITTGAIAGKYYELGRMIQRLLDSRGIESFVVHSDGSIENAAVLASGRAALAIMQYDTALAARAGVSVYDFDFEDDEPNPSVPEVRGLRRIAALHEDRVHVFARAELLRKDNSVPASGRPLTLADLPVHESTGESLKVWLGPERSGSRLLAQAILLHHGIHLTDVSARFMSDADMLTRYYSGEIDVGFFASHVPSRVLRPLVDDTNTVLLSLEPKARVDLRGPAVTVATIESGTYACQPEGSPEIQTLATRALLVTTEDVPTDVEAITEAVFDGEAFLGIPGGRASMAQDIPSLPLHPGAETHYRKAGYLPAAPSLATQLFDWLSVTWRTLAILVILVAGYRGVLEFRRELAAVDLYERALVRFTKNSNGDTASDLLKIRTELNERVVQKSWEWGALDRGRWHQIHDLLNELLSDGKDNWARTLLGDARAVLADPGLDEETRRARLDTIKKQVWSSVEAGALDSAQHAMFAKLLDQGREPPQQESDEGGART